MLLFLKMVPEYLNFNTLNVILCCMRSLNLVFILFLFVSCQQKTSPSLNFFEKNNVIWQPTDQVFILFRHAEKQTGEDPELTKDGFKRAENLKNILNDIKPTKFYSTNTKRTKQTIDPILKKAKAQLNIYQASEIDSLSTSLIRNSQGIHVISGHSNTTPNFANALCDCKTFLEIDESDFGNIFVVVSGESTKTYSLKY